MMLAMKQNAILTIASLLSILLVTFHLADDIGRGFEQGGVSSLTIVPILVVWLYATLVFVERRAGYVINLALSLLTLAIPIVHMSGNGVGAGSRIANSDGAFFFVWTLIALGVIALFSVILSVRGLWRLRSRSRQGQVQLETFRSDVMERTAAALPRVFRPRFMGRVVGRRLSRPLHST